MQQFRENNPHRAETTIATRWTLVLAVAVGLVLPFAGAMAQGVSWETVSVQGEGKVPLCGPGTLYSSFAGNSAALVFTNFTVDLPANAPHNSGAEFGACRIVSRLVIPKGYFLASLSQTTMAGVVKSDGARGEIRTRLDLANSGGQGGAIGGGKIETRTRFAPADEMNQPLLNLSGSIAATASDIQNACRTARQSPTTINMEFRASIMGQRKTPGASIIIAIDSSDVQLDLNMRFASCP